MQAKKAYAVRLREPSPEQFELIYAEELFYINKARRQGLFRKRNACLDKYYESISAYDYYLTLFGDAEKRRVYHLNRKYPRRASGYDELEALAMTTSEIFISDCDYFGDFWSANTQKVQYALTLDIDQIDPTKTETLCRRINKAKVKPTLLLSSGNGVHLKYVFDVPVETYAYRKPFLKHLQQALYRRFKGMGHSTNLALIQPYRMAGSRTKFGDITRGFVVGSKVNIEVLAKYAGLRIPPGWNGKMYAPTPGYKEGKEPVVKNFDVASCPQPGCNRHVIRLESRKVSEFYFWACPDRSHPLCEDVNGQPGGILTFKNCEKNSIRKIRADQASLLEEIRLETGSAEKMILPDAHIRFYEYCLQRCYTHLKPGHRRRGLWALAIVGYKSRRYVSKGRLVEDLEALVRHLNALTPADPLGEDDLKNALLGWKNKYADRTAETLEEHFGWKFERKS